MNVKLRQLCSTHWSVAALYGYRIHKSSAHSSSLLAGLCVILLLDHLIGASQKHESSFETLIPLQGSFLSNKHEVFSSVSPLISCQYKISVWVDHCVAVSLLARNKVILSHMCQKSTAFKIVLSGTMEGVDWCHISRKINYQKEEYASKKKMQPLYFTVLGRPLWNEILIENEIGLKLILFRTNFSEQGPQFYDIKERLCTSFEVWMRQSLGFIYLFI